MVQVPGHTALESGIDHVGPLSLCIKTEHVTPEMIVFFPHIGDFFANEFTLVLYDNCILVDGLAGEDAEPIDPRRGNV